MGCPGPQRKEICGPLLLIERLAAYEDTGLEPEAVEALAEEQANDPLTLEELQEMDGQPVWICKPNGIHGNWALVDTRNEVCQTVRLETAFFHGYGTGWLAYRRKPAAEKA